MTPGLFFILGVACLWLRNAPLAVILPPWSHGDEMAHLDYAMKIGRGHLPLPNELMERSLFQLHKKKYDSRYISAGRPVKINRPRDLGLAAYSYEAIQPPLPYLVYAAFRIPLRAAGIPLLAQVKILRLAALLVVTAGLFVLYRTFRSRTDLSPYWSVPLLLIPLLAQDMFFSINTDVFAFFFGCAFIGAVFRLFDRPLSAGRWAFLAAVTALAMWTKATCVFLLALWLVLSVMFVHSTPGRGNKKRLAGLAAVFFLAAAAFGSPWYIVNQMRQGYTFGYTFNGKDGIPYKPFPPSPLNWRNTKRFANAFCVTVIRGEFFWKGKFFKGLPDPWDLIFAQIFVGLIFAAGLAAVIFRLPGTRAGPFILLAAYGAGLIFSLFVIYVVWGGLPFYHARYAFVGLYPIIFLISAGWRRLIPDDRWAAIVPAVLLFGFNAAYTIRLLSGVI